MLSYTVVVEKHLISAKNMIYQSQDPTFQHQAGVRLQTSCYHLAESCVFNKQSLPPGMCCFPNQKIGEHPLWGHFAELLRLGSVKQHGQCPFHNLVVFVSLFLVGECGFPDAFLLRMNNFVRVLW
ncbi:hypothetical protein TB2_027467 [Malus domestica]